MAPLIRAPNVLIVAPRYVRQAAEDCTPRASSRRHGKTPLSLAVSFPSPLVMPPDQGAPRRASQPNQAAKAAQRGVFAYLDSTEETELQGGIDVALQRYQQYRELIAAFDRRARIERAKGILMERHGIGDQEAFDRLRGEARNSRRQLIDVVEEVVADEA